MSSFRKTTTKLSKLLQCDNSKLYILFRVSKNTFITWKSRNHIPYREIVKIAIRYDLDFNYLLKDKNDLSNSSN